jgi:hypothetical protein
MSSSSSSIFHGAEVREGVLVSGDATVMAFCRHENKNNFVILDVDERKLFCDNSVSKWLPSAVASHLAKMSKSLVEKAPVTSSVKDDGSAAASTVKKPRSSRQR